MKLAYKRNCATTKKPTPAYVICYISHEIEEILKS